MNNNGEIWLSKQNNRVRKNEKIKFCIREGVLAKHTMWKVQNDRKSSEVLAVNEIRGEITESKTQYHDESTLYAGSHYVECFLISKNNICIARSRCNVIIEK